VRCHEDFVLTTRSHPARRGAYRERTDEPASPKTAAPAADGCWPGIGRATAGRSIPSGSAPVPTICDAADQGRTDGAGASGGAAVAACRKLGPLRTLRAALGDHPVVETMTPRRRKLTTGAFGCVGGRKRVTAAAFLTHNLGETATSFRTMAERPSAVNALAPRLPVAPGRVTGQLDPYRRPGRTLRLLSPDRNLPALPITSAGRLRPLGPLGIRCAFSMRLNG
jgi:hypothetical protein